MKMITLKIEEEVAVDILMNRLNEWTEDEDVRDLYREMYESYLDGGVFSCTEFDPMVIVDNDWVNYTDVLNKEDIEASDWEKILELGVGDCSCESFDYGNFGFIEALNEEKGLVLIRW